MFIFNIGKKNEAYGSDCRTYVNMNYTFPLLLYCTKFLFINVFINFRVTRFFKELDWRGIFLLSQKIRKTGRNGKRERRPRIRYIDRLHDIYPDFLADISLSKRSNDLSMFKKTLVSNTMDFSKNILITQ
ncbi:hypothetical protein DesyoDRAFT_3648 [Desulfosporosinus youngiae DSM 17734]|uniref:Uncharacterized protein n=1 Tax=Desulfosporosinus youngiae DSM 17734 TaxID=768710 RepID=H5XW53_9FIRM|nr:hypothetical protein DesyoDRAFT_3648 [Desulfosporosinus youngiae DSM 17734]